MTREEAIEILKTDSCVDCGVGSLSPCTCTFDSHCDIKDAMEMAIKALEQQPCDDCVSRTQAIEWIENLRQMDKCFGNYEDDYFPLSEVIDRLKNVPPATPTQSWIPVSEKLPESEGLYLVSVKNDRLRQYSKTCWFNSHLNWFSRQDVIAWQPLPQPYEEKRGNENGSN